MAKLNVAILLLGVVVVLASADPHSGPRWTFPYGGAGIINAEGIPWYANDSAKDASVCPNKHRCKPCWSGGCHDGKNGSCTGNWTCPIVYTKHRLNKLREPLYMDTWKIMARAVGWLVNTFQYTKSTNLETCSGQENYTCPSFGFTADCIGYANMAFDFSPDAH
eukprot:gene21720-8397_t